MALPFSNLLRGLLDDPPPSVAVEFSAHAVAAACWSPGATRPERMAVRPLPANALRPSPVRENIQEVGAVVAAVSSALQEVNEGGRPSRRDVALLLPDLSARVTVLSVENLPTKPDEIMALVKFRMKKAVPFDVDDAVISIQVQGHEVLAALSPREVIRQYEGVVEELGYNPGLVTLSTLAGLSLVVPPTAAGAGAMLVRRGDAQATIAISSAGRLHMLRVSEWADHDVQELFQDVFSSAIFFQDNLHGRVERIYQCGLEEQKATLLDRIETEMGIAPRPLVIPGANAEQAGFLGIFGMLAAQSQTV